MAGAHRSVSASSCWPASRILSTLFAGSAVMFAVVTVQDGSRYVAEKETGPVVRPLPAGTAPQPSREIVAPPPGGPSPLGQSEVPPSIAPQSGWTVPTWTPPRVGVREVPAAPDLPADQTARSTSGDTPGWETSLRETLVPRPSARTASAPPAAATQNPTPADDTDQPANSLIEDLLGRLGAGL